MTTKRICLAFVLTLSVAASAYFVSVSSAQRSAPAVDQDHQIMATLYMQKAGEYRALAYQAFNIATWRLGHALEKKTLKALPKTERKRPIAVMVDIDETMLDNSPAQARTIVDHKGFDLKDWYAWGEMRKAKPIPGAVDFANYAFDHGVRVFFVSNRDEIQKAATMDNLRSAGFKDIKDDNVMLRTKESGKEARRDIIRQKYRIVMFIGDNLDDLSNVFERRSVADRFAEVDKARSLFGAEYIVLPNAMYGTWENALYDYKNLSPAEKEKVRADSLELP